MDTENSASRRREIYACAIVVNLLRKVLDMPVVDCATYATTNESVRSALDLL